MKDPSRIIVATMMKVGSRSLVRTIKEQSAHDVTLIHNLAGNKIDPFPTRRSEKKTEKWPVLRRMQATKDVFSGEVDHGVWRGPPVYLVSGVRDPVARAVSLIGFISNRIGYTEYGVTVRDGGTPEALMTLLQTCLKTLRGGEPSTDSVINWFCRAISDYDQWFDRVTGRGFGIDAYDHAFDPSRCALTAGSNSRLLVFRVEDMGKRQLRDSLGDFLRTDIPSIKNDDKSGERRFSELYKGFKAIAKFDEETLDWFYDNRTVRHFYSAAEIQSFRKTWSMS